jgi:glutamate/tyrosine decarboxylase-like PLP-dependent enzyme
MENKVSKPILTLPSEEMRELGYKIVDLLVEHFTTLPEKSVTRTASRTTMEKVIQAEFPEKGIPIDAVLEQVREKIFSHIMHLDHPRFFAFVPSPSNFVSAMAEALIAGYNSFAGTWLESPGPGQIELNTIEWLRQEIGLPLSAGGLFVSGGSMANLTALAVARKILLDDKAHTALIYFSDQTHSSVERALRILGFSEEQMRKLPCDEGFRLRLSDLEQAVFDDRAHGKHPFCVVANAGTTNTGAIDPLPELADFCEQEGLWLHADGAYGASVILCEQGKKLLKGLERVHSLAIDPHKWLFQPYEMGCVLVRDFRHLRHTFHILPEYLKDIEQTEQEVNFCEYGVQLTRSFRALKLWLSLNIFGVEAFREAVEKGFRLAEYAEEVLRNHECFKIVTPAQMAIITFRYHVPGLSETDLDSVNEKIVDAMIARQFAMISTTRLKGHTVLRMCTINPRTTPDDISATIDVIKMCGDELSGQSK